MAVLKCKMCGGDLDFLEGASTAECQYCGSVQTIPKVDDEKKLTLFARANRLRTACEFDKAAGIYEAIVADFPEEAEAYWGLVLCKYGIEYVDDPATGKKIPTCHRSSFDSIMDDSDFELALENADTMARRVYRDEAKTIENIRKGIIALSANEDPYDIFICYKETDENGDRTLDSVLAQDVYDALIDKGYRVFFARISLEDKLGLEYEPYIFAALNSAKIMLVVGTDYEYFNAVWVKNEWSRFLKMMTKDKEKHLIPCFKGIDAYDMPKEFARLQAQDLGKVGAIQDLLRGIEKLLPRQAAAQTVMLNRTDVSSADSRISSLLDRAYMAIDDNEWEEANEFFEAVLNNDAKNPDAYLGKALIQERCRNLGEWISRRRAGLPQIREQILYLEPDTEHIDAMAEKYSLPGYLDANTIRKLYEFTLAYSSCVVDCKSQYEKEENHWNNNRDLVRAEKFAIGTAEALLSEKKAFFAELAAQIEQAEVAEAAEKQTLQARYAAHLQQADAQAETLYAKASEEKENKYQHLRQIIENSTDRQSLMRAVLALKQFGDYRDCKDLIQVGTEKCKDLGAPDVIAECHDKAVLAKSRLCVSASERYPLCVGIDAYERAYFSNSCSDTPESWSDIVELSAGYAHILALDRFGKVHAVGDNTYGQCDVGAWINIASVHACGNLSVASRVNGSVAVSSSNGHYGLEDWMHIKKVCTDGSRLIIMKTNGTVVEIGEEDKIRGNTSSWKNIVDIVACNGRAVGLADDGTVMVVGTDFNPNRWKDIIAVAVNRNNIIGLKQDGKVVFDGISEFGEKQVEEWVGIVDISAQNGYCLGVRLNGTVVAAGRNDNGQCNVQQWRNVVAVYAAKTCAFGLCADGSVLCTDSNTYGGLENWKLFDNIDTLRADISNNWVLRQKWQAEDRCRYCGGELKGLFGKKCAVCGNTKDY